VSGVAPILMQERGTTLKPFDEPVEEMRTFIQTTVKHIALWCILLILVTACTGRTPAALATPELSSIPTEDLSGLSQEDFATLHSLERVADYPFYVMHYSGEYNFPQIGRVAPPASDFACSLFATLSEGGDMLYGRNFDWEFSPALLLFTDPPGGYASVSMVDLTFLNISPDAAMSLTSLPLAERTALLAAPSMPFDGMNEYGLTIAMAAVPEAYPSDAGDDPSKPTIGSIGIIRKVLDRAKSVDEAILLFEQYNIDFSGGPPVHYLMADPGGKAVLVEFSKGKMILLPNEAAWHLATNHLRCSASGDGGCPRYRTLSEQLAAAKGQKDAPAAMQLLSKVAQSNTQWSVVYNMTGGDVSVVIGQSYKTTFPFHLDRIRP
jgi:hypothetical protein